MKRKPSKRTTHHRDQKALRHIVNNGCLYHHGTVSLGTASFNQSVYASQSVQFKKGDTITIDSDSGFGDKIYYGKNINKIHPARRHKEKNKWCYEAVISTDIGTCVIRKMTDTVWVVQGPPGAIM